ncbi:MAG: hypothetical protein MZV63_49140 [Marinilabiliales bacterium]|nr:hypothetical protein [Marinilabiliales bacterium]
MPSQLPLPKCVEVETGWSANAYSCSLANPTRNTWPPKRHWVHRDFVDDMHFDGMVYGALQVQ